MIANLIMYHRAENADAHVRYWNLIRQNLLRQGIECPTGLSQSAGEFDVWLDKNLLLSQTCGMPYRLWLHDKVQLVGTPDYGLDGCPPGYYRSAIVVRSDDPREQLTEFTDAVFAYNQTFSQSGYAALWNHLPPGATWYVNQLHTGQHRLSAQAVANGNADIAAIDAVTYRMLERYDEFCRRLRVLEWTGPTPGLPYVTGPDSDRQSLFDAVQTAIDQLQPADRQALGLQQIVSIAAKPYLDVPNPDITIEFPDTGH